MAAGAPNLLDSLGEASRARFERVRELLTALGVKHQVEPRLVRGLDYYTGTIFEVKTEAGDLGAQNTIVGGGRYDRLVGSLGGQGDAGDRLRAGHRAHAAGDPRRRRRASSPALGVFFAPMDDAALAFAMPIVHRLRGDGIRVEIEHRPRQGRRDDEARRQAARARRRDHRQQRGASGKLTVKDLAHGTQSEVSVADLATKSASCWTRLSGI